MLRIVIGAAIGFLVGAGLGLRGKRRGGRRMLGGSPLIVALLGALAGGAIGCISNPMPGDMASYERIPSVASSDEFRKDVIEADKPVLVDFYATWCVHCSDLAPAIGTLSQAYRGRVKFVKVDGDQLPGLIKEYSIKGYPTVMVFQAGRPVNTWAGARDEYVYRAALDAAVSKNASIKRLPERTTGNEISAMGD